MRGDPRVKPKLMHFLTLPRVEVHNGVKVFLKSSFFYINQGNLLKGIDNCSGVDGSVVKVH